MKNKHLIVYSINSDNGKVLLANTFHDDGDEHHLVSLNGSWFYSLCFEECDCND